MMKKYLVLSLLVSTVSLAAPDISGDWQGKGTFNGLNCTTTPFNIFKNRTKLLLGEYDLMCGEEVFTSNAIQWTVKDDKIIYDEKEVGTISDSGYKIELDVKAADETATHYLFESKLTIEGSNLQLQLHEVYTQGEKVIGVANLLFKRPYKKFGDI